MFMVKNACVCVTVCVCAGPPNSDEEDVDVDTVGYDMYWEGYRDSVISQEEGNVSGDGPDDSEPEDGNDKEGINLDSVFSCVEEKIDLDAKRVAYAAVCKELAVSSTLTWYVLVHKQYNFACTFRYD